MRLVRLVRMLVAEVTDRRPGACAYCGRRPLPVDAVAYHAYPPVWLCGDACLRAYWDARQI